MGDLLQKNWLGRVLQHYFKHDVPRESAALTYYLFFALFPLLIFASTLLGVLNLDIASITRALDPILPSSVVELVESYLVYVTANQNSTLMWFSLFFSVYFPFRAANTLMRAVRRAYHVKRPKAPLHYNLKVLIFTVFLLVTIIVGFAAAVLGRELLGFISRYITINKAIAEVWLQLRFLLLAAMVWALVTLCYSMAPDERIPTRDIVPGTLISIVCWLLTTLGFSFYVENFANYSIIYGSIGAVIVVLVWLNISSMLMIMGAEINVLLIERRGKNREGGTKA